MISVAGRAALLQGFGPGTWSLTDERDTLISQTETPTSGDAITFTVPHRTWCPKSPCWCPSDAAVRVYFEDTLIFTDFPWKMVQPGVVISFSFGVGW